MRHRLLPPKGDKLQGLGLLAENTPPPFTPSALISASASSFTVLRKSLLDGSILLMITCKMRCFNFNTWQNIEYNIVCSRPILFALGSYLSPSLFFPLVDNLHSVLFVQKQQHYALD